MPGITLSCSLQLFFFLNEAFLITHLNTSRLTISNSLLLLSWQAPVFILSSLVLVTVGFCCVGFSFPHNCDSQSRNIHLRQWACGVGFVVLGFFPNFCLVECQDEKENTLLNTEHFVVDADAVGSHGAGSSVLPAFPGTPRQEKVEDDLGIEDRNSSVKKVEGDGVYSTLQAAGSSSQGSVVLDGQNDFGQPLDFSGDTKVGLAQEPTGQSGSQGHSESYCPAGTEMEAKKEITQKASSGVPGAPCRQEETGPAPHRSRSAAAQNSYKGSSVLESRGSLNLAKGGKFLPVKKKPRTFYSAGRSQGTQ